LPPRRREARTGEEAELRHATPAVPATHAGEIESDDAPTRLGCLAHKSVSGIRVESVGGRQVRQVRVVVCGPAGVYSREWGRQKV